MPHTTLDLLVESATARLAERFRQKPNWIVAAPGRVNIIGEHIDYNGGFVLPMAIDHYCVIAAAPRDGNAAAIYSLSANDEAAIDLAVQNAPARACTFAPGAAGSASVSRPLGHWSDYVAGVIAGCNSRGMHAPAFSAVVESAVPVGGGLSSSAAIEVATATLVEAMTGKSLDPVSKALLCQKAEHEYAGVPCGIMDQFASVMCRAGHLMLLDCRSQQIEHIPFANPEITVLIVNTHVKHELAGGEYAQRRTECESTARKLGVETLRDANLDQLNERRKELTDNEYRRARHAITEIARTVEAAAAVTAGDWPRIGKLMYASHDSLRDDYEVSCPELDLLVKLAHDLGPAGGVIGSRMTGGGFGGCTVSLVETAKVDHVAQALAESYRAETAIEPSVITSRPARGAHIIATKMK